MILFPKNKPGTVCMNKVMQIHLNKLCFETMHIFLHIFPNESNYTFEWIDTFKKCNAQIFRLLNLILGAGLMWVPPGTQKYDFL